MINKIQTLFWFLKKGYSKQIFSILSRGENENTRKESTQWCEKNAKPIDEVLQLLNSPYLKFDELENEIFKYAVQQENSCPVKMGGRGAIDVLYSLTKSRKPETILETGVAYGWSSLAFLASLTKNGRLYSNDMPYPKLGNEDFVGTVVPEKFKVKWKLFRYPDVMGLSKIFELEDKFDIIHYDSDKSYQGRMWSQPLLWSKLNKDGLFISDDINDNLAFKHFCESLELIPLIFKYDSKFVGVIQK